MSVYMTVFAGSTPVGGLLAGWLASSFGSPVALAFGGGTSALVTVVAAVWVIRSGHFKLPRRRLRRRTMADEALDLAPQGEGLVATQLGRRVQR